VFKICATVCAVLLAGCGAPGTRPSGGLGVPALPAHPAAGIPAYRIDASQSELRLLVHRAGPMARLGHNHVILNRAVTGWVEGVDSPGSESFSVRVPVADFVVDDSRARAEEGLDFSAEVPEEAKLGTRRNMLGTALLDAGRFPDITLISNAITPARGMAGPGNLVATVAIDVAGHRSTLQVPFKLERSADRLIASGVVVLRQSAMGLTPISVMLGALQVQDEVTVKFKFVAISP